MLKAFFVLALQFRNVTFSLPSFGSSSLGLLFGKAPVASKWAKFSRTNYTVCRGFSMCPGFLPVSWKEAVLPLSPWMPSAELRVSGVLEMQKMAE